MIEEEINNVLPVITQLRHELHRYPEVSGREKATAQRLAAFFQKYQPQQLISGLGSGTGLAAVFKGAEPGPSLMFRADMDALPIPETIVVDHGSRQEGVSHKCGHDGHMAMVAGLAPLLFRNPPKKGAVILLMQPAEETGMGAKALLEDPHFMALAPNYIFGLHNLPAFPMGQLVLREGTFCAASRGLRITLRGRTSHAAEPGLGLSPANTLAGLMLTLPTIPQQLQVNDLLLLTITHAQLGEPSFGVSPGEAHMQLTLRANQEEDMKLLIAAVEEHVQASTHVEGLEVSLSYHEIFPATQNAEMAMEILRQAAQNTSFSINEKGAPFRWSEDFGHYNSLAPAAFFGLGAGENLPNLHNPAYDFPDALLPYGLMIYWRIKELLND